MRLKSLIINMWLKFDSKITMFKTYKRRINIIFFESIRTNIIIFYFVSNKQIIVFIIMHIN